MTRGFDWRRMPGMRLAGLAALAFLYLPLLVLVVLSFNANRVAMVWGGLSPKWFAVALGNEDLRRTAVNSLVVATVATLVSTLLALPAALALERGGGWRGRGAGEALITLPLVAPEIVTAVATLVLFEAIGLHAGLGNVMLAHIVFCIPFALLPIRARLRGLGPELEDAARDLYAGPWRTFRLVTLPLLAPAVIGRRDAGLRGLARRFFDHADGGAGRGHHASGLPLRDAAARRDPRGQRGRHAAASGVGRGRGGGAGGGWAGVRRQKMNVAREVRACRSAPELRKPIKNSFDPGSRDELRGVVS